jgi:nitrogen fixation protein NifU and related proteins
MSLSDDLYRETILDHYHNPRNRGKLEDPGVTVEGVNPLCGDELTLYMNVKDGAVDDVRIEAKGCSISMASGSMMAEAVQGQPIEKVEHAVQLFKQMMLDKNKEVDMPEELEDLEALQGVKKYPVRIKCALLPWNTLLQAIHDSAANAHTKGVIGKVVES